MPSPVDPSHGDAAAAALLRDTGRALYTREVLDQLLLDALAEPGLASRPVRAIADLVASGGLDRAEAALARISAATPVVAEEEL